MESVLKVVDLVIQINIIYFTSKPLAFLGTVLQYVVNFKVNVPFHDLDYGRCVHYREFWSQRTADWGKKYEGIIELYGMQI